MIQPSIEVIRADIAKLKVDAMTIVLSKRFFERWRTLSDRVSATLIAYAERAGAGIATVSGS